MWLWDLLWNTAAYGLLALLLFCFSPGLIQVGGWIQNSESTGAATVRYMGVVSILLAFLYVSAGVAHI